MTVTYYNASTKETYGSFTASGKNGLFTHKQKMQMASLRIKLLSTLGLDAVTVMVVVDADGSQQATNLLSR